MSDKTAITDLADDQVVCVATGILHAVGCAPKGMPADEVERKFRDCTFPAGTPAGWTIDAERIYPDGTTQPGPCSDDATRQHWVFLA